MGELHLDIIRDRIWKEYKVEAELGPLQVAYRETSQTTCTHTLDINKTIGICVFLCIWLCVYLIYSPSNVNSENSMNKRILINGIFF